MAAAGEPGSGLADLDLEDLMNIEVTSVSKRLEKMSQAASAIYVITNEDIRRSGATTIPDLLRTVPGLEVASIDASKWAITSRGFNGRFANKLLVLIDGMSVYTPQFSGVYWETRDVPLEDIERIEVIRGPGATLWGANAVNGVINIITKKASETQGGSMTAGGGSEEQGFGGVRYGGKLGDDAFYRIYTKYFNRDDFPNASGVEGADDWRVLRGGFRIDWDPTDVDALTLQGDVYDGSQGERSTILMNDGPPEMPLVFRTPNRKIDVSGGNLLSRWHRKLSESSDLTLQLYYDRTERMDPLIISEIRDTIDVDMQHSFAFGDRQRIIWGLGYRYTADENSNSFALGMDPDERADDLFSAFFQDEITLIPDRLAFTLGSKVEHNDYTGWEGQPSARLRWTPNPNHTVWAAVSRAVRTPSRAESDVRILTLGTEPLELPNGMVIPPYNYLLSLQGSRDFESEDLVAYELGYRLQATERLYLDFATFYNDYSHLRTLEPGMPDFMVLPPVFPLIGGNKMKGESHGIEITADYNALDWWRLTAGYTYLRMNLHLEDDSMDPTDPESAEGENPQNQCFLQSRVDLPKNVEFDTILRYVDNLPSFDVHGYVTLDVRLGWKPTKNLDLSIVGRNLLDNQHLEYRSTAFVNTEPTEVPRSVYGKVTWSF